jgi:hypothetical protein
LSPLPECLVCKSQARQRQHWLRRKQPRLRVAVSKSKMHVGTLPACFCCGSFCAATAAIGLILQSVQRRFRAGALTLTDVGSARA